MGSYDASSAPQPEELKPESAEVAHGNQYQFPSSNPGYTLEDAQRLNAAFNETSSQMQNLAPFSDVMVRFILPWFQMNKWILILRLHLSWE